VMHVSLERSIDGQVRGVARLRTKDKALTTVLRERLIKFE
ncbi:MAG: hypothetical protein EZS28_046684, partial [Streblomastix strix]